MCVVGPFPSRVGWGIKLFDKPLQRPYKPWRFTGPEAEFLEVS
jgi:hypothetical protein